MMQNVQGGRVAHMAQVVSTSYSIPERYTEASRIGSASCPAIHICKGDLKW